MHDDAATPSASHRMLILHIVNCFGCQCIVFRVQSVLIFEVQQEYTAAFSEVCTPSSTLNHMQLTSDKIDSCCCVELNDQVGRAFWICLCILFVRRSTADRLAQIWVMLTLVCTATSLGNHVWLLPSRLNPLDKVCVL